MYSVVIYRYVHGMLLARMSLALFFYPDETLISSTAGMPFLFSAEVKVNIVRVNSPKVAKNLGISGQIITTPKVRLLFRPRDSLTRDLFSKKSVW